MSRLSHDVVRGRSRPTSNHLSSQADEVRCRDGSIVKITMENFITYDSVVCYPGESLNVVIGPNGTGKSTILSAIVLGLGGKPSILGKPQSSIQDFIKHNRQEACVEIELRRTNQRNTVIKRIITRAGKSVWHLNGRPVSMKEIEAETRSLNIQIDNLCQVLPQDRVQDFAKLNKQELLEATQKAVGKEGMSEVHSKLKELQREQKQLETQIEADIKKREVEQGEVNRLQGAVEKMERRKGIEAQAEACRLKLSILKYAQQMDVVKECIASVKEAENKVKNLDAQIDPYKQQINQAEANFNSVKNRYAGSDKRIRKQFQTVSEIRGKLESHRDDILGLEANLATQLKYSESQLQKEKEVRQTVSKLQNDIACQQSIPTEQLVAQARKLKQEVEGLALQMKQLESRKLQIGNEIHELNSEFNGLNRNISNMENLKDMRMKLLNEASPDAYKAARWIDANREMFEKPVYLPLIVELDVNPQFARYIENAVGYLDLTAITCESQNDMELIVDKCREQMGLRINVLQVTPRNELLEPSFSLNDLRRRFGGFEGFLKDYVKGPKTLLDFLSYRKNLHNIPVSLTEVEASEVVSNYYAGHYKKGHRRSRFGDGLMFLSNPIPGTKFFKVIGNEGDLVSLKQRAMEIKSLLLDKKKKQTEYDQQINDIGAKREQTRNEQQKLHTAQTNLQAMRFQLSHKEKELANMEKNRVDPSRLEAQFKVKAKEAAVQFVMAQEPFYKSLKELDSLMVESQVLKFELLAAKAAVSQSKRLCKAEQAALENLKRELEVLRNRLSDARTQAQAQVRAIGQKNGGRKVDEIWNDPNYQKIFSTLPDVPDELESLIEDMIARANLLGGSSDANVIREFQTHVNNLEKLNAGIDNKESRAKKLIEDMGRRQSEWRNELNELVGTIATNFERYFKEMGCAGDVLLHTGNEEHDYDNYGLRIRVKFRATEQLQDLNAHTQSGGERAVSTAIYMLSLQELTPAPFRLVDEINQGMDSMNERKVYDLLMRSTSRPGTPQYFLLTPKLLKNMQYSDGTTVLCVMNSACAPSHKTWNIEKFIDIRRQLHSTSDMMEDDD